MDRKPLRGLARSRARRCRAARAHRPGRRLVQRIAARGHRGGHQLRASDAPGAADARCGATARCAARRRSRGTRQGGAARAGLQPGPRFLSPGLAPLSRAGDRGRRLARPRAAPAAARQARGRRRARVRALSLRGRGRHRAMPRRRRLAPRAMPRSCRAITGQLAGAHYGASSLPPEMRDGLARAVEIEALADRLLDSAPRARPG